MTISEQIPEWPVMPLDAYQPDDDDRAFSEKFRHQHRQLLAATAAHMSKQGYNGTQVDHVAADVGVSKRTFYEHFGSKERCFAEIIGRAQQRITRRLCAAAEANMHRGPDKVYRAMITEWASIHRENLDMTAVARREAAVLPIVARQRETFMAVFAEVIAVAAIRLGSRIPRDDLNVTAHTLAWGVWGYFTTDILGRVTVEHEVDVVTDLVLAALALR